MWGDLWLKIKSIFECSIVHTCSSIHVDKYTEMLYYQFQIHDQNQHHGNRHKNEEIFHGFINHHEMYGGLAVPTFNSMSVLNQKKAMSRS